jgi:pimeloyl-ACP methyl ester carboxylesterase
VGKSAKRLVYLLIMLAVFCGTLAPAGWARDSRSLVSDAWAWMEEGELRLQIELGSSPDNIALAVTQDGEEASRTFRKKSRLSVKVKPVTNNPLTVELKSLSGKKSVIRWALSLPDRVLEENKELEIKEASWDKKAAKKEDKLELLPMADPSDEPLEEPSVEETDKEDSHATEQADEQQADVARWAKDFYRDFADSDKPKESALSSRLVVFEMEPNDKFGQADWLFDKKDAHGKIGKSGDVDMWKIKSSQDGVINISLRDIPNRQDYNLFVFDQDYQELGHSKQEGQEEETIEGITIEKNKWYYVEVKGNKDSFHKDFYYRLRADFLSEQGGVKVDEYEPNNLISEAYQLGADYDTTIQGNLHSLSDADFYRFSFTLASTIVLDLKELPEGMDVDLYLMDNAGKVLSKSEKPKNANEQIVFNANPGEYIVKVAASKRSEFTANSYQLSVAAKTIPVILIPGIGGSRLEVEEKGKVSEIWLGLGDSLIGINDPRHRRLLSLQPIKPNSVEVEPREPGISIFPEREDEGFRAIEYLSYSPLDPIRNSTEQYYSMVKSLEKMGYKKFRTMFAMPYDWRYSNTQNAALLKQKIDLALERTGARQVHLVAHSMGGLLVRETLLANVSYQSKVSRVVYMGTPFLGSPRAYQAIQYGYNFSIPWMDEETGKIISQYAPAVYELLPSKKYFQTTSFLKKNKNEPYTYDEFLSDKDIRLNYSPLVKQAGKLHEKWDKKTISVPQYSIVGQGHSTLLGYLFDHYHNNWAPFYDKGLGDGTVPYLSASYAQKDIKKKYYVNGEHAKLPTIPQVIQQVSQLLKGIEDIQPGLRKSSKKNDYLYYILSQEDGEFPEIALIKSGKTLTLDPDKKEVWEDLSIEYHGNIVVVHVKDGKPLIFESSPKRNAKKQPRVTIQRFSSEDSKEEQETGKRYWLEETGMTEIPESR